MAEWRPFGATNAPDTCLWCGNKLRHKVTESHYEEIRVEVPEELRWDPAVTHRKQSKSVADKRAEKGGDYQDGFFCGLRCGYQFGERLAQLGRRLNPRD